MHAYVCIYIVHMSFSHIKKAFLLSMPEDTCKKTIQYLLKMYQSM